MAGTPDQRKPTFFWQGVLILLPVALMAGFGLWAIGREHRAVEPEARQRAREILQSLPYNFAGRVASRMGMLSAQSAHANAIPESAAGLGTNEPDGESVGQWGAAGNIIMADTLTNQQWTSLLWTSLPGAVWPINFLLDARGDFWDSTYRDAPQPPAWLTAMTKEQRTAWDALRQADQDRALARGVSRFAKEFLNTGPPAPARECARFIQLRVESSARSDAEALDALLAFGRNCSDVETDAGVPLSNLVMAEALRRASKGPVTAALRRQLEFEVRQRPSLLTPALLDQAERLAGGDRAFAGALAKLRAVCQARAVQRDLAERIKQSGVVDGPGTVTNLWMDAPEQRWFCVLQPEQIFAARFLSNQVVITRSNVFTEVLPYPESFLTKTFGESLAESRISLPDYFGLAIELEGEPIPLPDPWEHSIEARLAGQTLTGDRTNPPAILARLARSPAADDVLAAQQIALSLPASLSEDSPFGGQKGATEYDAMPSHPRLRLRVVLADRGLLYARQRQRELLFGSLIAFSLLAAVVGWVAAYRAFRWQLRLNEMKSNFVSSVSHELRAPIAAVRLMAESLERGKVPDTPKQNQYFRFIVQECRRLSSLIENVLDFSRIEQGRKQYEFEPTDVAALTRETVKLMEPYAAERGVGLETSNIQHPTSNIQLDMDGRAIQQALVNLIDNAIKHSPKGETVTVGIEVQSPGSRVLSPQLETGNPRGLALNPQLSTLNLFVEDHGPGIPPEEHEKIFERFYRRGSELRRETQGVGIGLSIVKHIVEAHGGRVTVRSAAGEGSRFTIEIPIRNER